MKSRLGHGDAETGRGVALGVEVDHEHPVAERGERGPEVDRGRRLADAALLVGDGHDVRAGPGVRHGRSLRSLRWPPSGRSRLGWRIVVEPPMPAELRLSRYAPSRPSETSQYPPRRRCFSSIAEERRRAARGRGPRRRRPPCGGRLSTRVSWTRRREVGGADDGSRRKAALRWSLSTRRTSRLGRARSAARAAITRPGKPAPDPRSSQSAGRRRPEAPELGRVRRSAGCQASARLVRDTRLMRGFHFSSRRQVDGHALDCFT